MREVDLVQVLLIEDNGGDAVLIRTCFEDASHTSGGGEYRVHHRQDLTEGLDFLSSNEVDVVLLDLDLPDSKGLDTLRRAADHPSSTPIVVLTGRTTLEVGDDAIGAGAQDYLNKGQIDAAILTRTVRYAIERQKLQSQMMELDRMVAMGTMAAGVGHEINNPLSYIVSNLQYVKRSIDGHRNKLRALHPEAQANALVDEIDRWREALVDGLEGARRVRDVVRSLRSLAGQATTEDPPARVNVAQSIDMACKMARHEIKYRAKLTLDLDEQLAVVASPSQLGQLFLNLLINAAQAIPMGAAQDNEIRVTLRDDGGRVVVSISDTGCGISDEQRVHIFEPFYSTKTSNQGTGLGLSICRRIVEELDGQIEVDSQPDQGTTFRLIFPSAGSLAEPKVEGCADRRMVTGLNILVIDDEESVGRALRRIFGSDNHVDCRLSGESALELLNSDGGPNYDVIFCDLMMPKMTGMAFYQAVLEQCPDMVDKLVFITGGTFTDEGERFCQTVPNHILYKPLRMSQLQQILTEFVVDA